MNRITVLILIAVFICNYSIAQDTGIQFEQGSWKEIMTKAQKANKPVFLDAYAEWCGPCKWMAKNTFTDPEVAEFYNANFINAKIDMEKGEGIELAKKYEVRAYPSLLYISPDGKIAHRTCGAAGPEAFIAMGKDAIDNDNNMSSYVRKYEGGQSDPEFIYNYARAIQQACLPPDEIVIEYLSSQPEEELIAEANWKIVKDYLRDYESSPFQYLMNNKKVFADKYSEKVVDDKIFSVYQSALFAFDAKNDLKGLSELKSKIRASGNPDAEKVILHSEMISYERKKQWNEYAEAAEMYAEKYVWDDPNALNNISWSFYENVDDKEKLNKALKWIRRSIEIEESYYNTDTFAALHFKLGNKDEAVKAAERAISLARESGDDPKETLELLEKINSSR